MIKIACLTEQEKWVEESATVYYMQIIIKRNIRIFSKMYDFGFQNGYSDIYLQTSL